MRIHKGQRSAWVAHDIALQAIQTLQAQPGPLTDSKASALAQLLLAFERLQERIRIHRRVPLPGTARPKAKASKGVRTPRQVAAAHDEPTLAEEPSPAPSPEPSPSPSPSPIPSTNS